MRCPLMGPCRWLDGHRHWRARQASGGVLCSGHSRARAAETSLPEPNRNDARRTSTLETVGPCQLIESLGSGGMGTVWRAVMLQDRPWASAGSVVAVKIIHPYRLEGTDGLARFEREAAVGSSIDHPAVVRTFAADSEVIADVTWHYLVMEFVQGKTVRELLRELGSLPEALVRHLGSRVARALAALHASGMLHRDVKPENVVITRDSVVKLMDFGIVRPIEVAAHAGEALTANGAFLGTVLYASPEQRLGIVLTPASDLYSLGVLLFESVTGRLPVGALQTGETVGALASSANSEVSPFLDEVLTQLMMPSPQDRFASADEVAALVEIGEASPWWRQDAAARGSAGARRPTIPVPRALPFTGREAPFMVLREAAVDARAGHGGFVLLEGEAGAGKSRLVAELVASLEDEPVDILYGSSAPGGVGPGIDAVAQAVVGHFGAARLASGISRHVSSRGVVPALVALLSGSSPPEAAQPLSPDILPGLFLQLARGLASRRTVVWIVEDLHFASPLGRAVVTAIGHGAKDQRLLLVATTRPGLPADDLQAFQSQGGVTRIRLDRLSLDEIRTILQAAFESAGIAEKLAPLVADKSDGNPLFLSALVDELRLQGVTADTPDRAASVARSIEEISVPSSISEMLMGRLGDLDDANRAILDAASIQGFEFDGALVARMLKRDPLDVLQALAGLARRHGVVRPRGALFAFDHHLLHELVLGQVPPALRTEYHAGLAAAYAAARGLQGLPPDDVPGESAVFLATHLIRGGRVDAGADFALAAFDHLATSAQSGSVLSLAALVSERTGAPLGQPPSGFDALRQARWHSHLGDAYWTGGVFAEAESHLEAALAALGVRVPRSESLRKLFIVRQALTQASHLVTPRSLVEAAPGRRVALREAARTASLVAQMQVYRSRTLDILLYALLSVNLAERASTESVFSLGLLGFTASSLRLRGRARRYFDRAREAGLSIRDRRELIHAMKFDAVDRYGRGELDASEVCVVECLDLARDLGYPLGLAEAHGMLAVLLEARGRFEDAARESLLPLSSPECGVSGGHRFFYEHRVARLRLFQTRFDEAAELVAAARTNVGEGDRLTVAMLRGVEARLHAVRGDFAAATAAAIEAGQVLRGHENGVPAPCRGALEDPAEALVSAWESAVAADCVPDAALVTATRLAVARVVRFAKLHAVCRPSALIVDARVDFLDGQAARGRARLAEAADLARRLGMAADEERARTEAAGHGAS